MALSKNVYKWLDPKQISLFVIVAAVVIIAIAEIAAEVIAPLALRTAGLPSSYLTYAYSISVIASVSAAVLSQTWQKKMALQPLLVIFLVVFLGATSILFFYQVWPLIVALVAITGASATATGILTVTSLQNQMPLSLQAQAISLWQGLVLMSSSAAIFVSSFLGLYAIVLLAIVALLLGVLPKMKRLK